jgi:cation diffusion facilitator family transporter
MDRLGARAVQRRARWSIAAALATIALKAGAYALTSSVGLLSDALESLVNLAAALTMVTAVAIAARPADETHPFGPGKAEQLSAAVEGLLLLGATAAIGVTAAERWQHPQALDHVAAGLAVSALAALVNGVVALALVRAGRLHRSPALVADGRHLLADVLTSIGVIAGVLGTRVTGWERLDPLVALAVGANVLVLAGLVLRRALRGLMDHALSADERATVAAVIARHQATGVRFLDVRTRDAGHQRFVTMRVQVPGDWTVEHGHALLDDLEHELTEVLPDTTVSTHLEPSSPAGT